MSAVNAPVSEPVARRESLVIAVVTAALLAPFVNKPFHVDDTVFIRVADQIQDSPLGPYAFKYNWFGEPQSMWIVTQHPPLHCYVLAGLGEIAGIREWTLHLGYLLIAVGCALLMHALARRFCRHPLTATMLTVAGPAFLVSATNLMADVLLLFFWLLAIYAVVRSADQSNPAGFWLAGLAGTGAAMTKYYGISVVPLLVVYSALRSRSFERSIRDNSFLVHALGLLLPVAAVVAWGMYAKSVCGVFHPLGAASYSIYGKSILSLQIVSDVGRTLSFFGGCLLWPIFLLPLTVRLSKKLQLAVVLLAVGVVGVECVLNGRSGELSLTPWDIALYGLMVVSGAMVTAAAIAGLQCRTTRPTFGRCPAVPPPASQTADAGRSRTDADSWLLGLWCFGTLVFCAFFNWTVNARAILPALFPAAVLVVRWVETFDGPAIWIRGLNWAIWPTAFVSLIVAWGDYEYASAGKTFAETTIRDMSSQGEEVYFAGHWGFQHYMEREGARPWNYQRQDSVSGGLIAFPAMNSGVYEPSNPSQFVDVRSFKSLFGVHTMSNTGRAGFYSSLSGPVPYNVFLNRTVDEFAIRRITDRPLSGNEAP